MRQKLLCGSYSEPILFYPLESCYQPACCNTSSRNNSLLGSTSATKYVIFYDKPLSPEHNEAACVCSFPVSLSGYPEVVGTSEQRRTQMEISTTASVRGLEADALWNCSIQCIREKIVGPPLPQSLSRFIPPQTCRTNANATEQ